MEKVEHPAHYGGKDNPYETIKVIEEWQCNFNIGSAIRYLSRHGKKPGEDAVTDLRKAKFYIEREIERLQALEAKKITVHVQPSPPPVQMLDPSILAKQLGNIP